jgi:AraC family transcriptional regulator
MDHYLLATITRTTEFIEEHLLEDLSLDQISGHVNLSKFHLLRIWKGASSTGLMEYVRRRRIAQSLGDLLGGSTSIDFISAKYGFSCERTYNRAFKEEYGITPAKWRRNPAPVNILDRFNADFMSHAGEGLVFFRSVTVLPTLSVAGYKYQVNILDNLANQTANRLGVEFFYNSRRKIMNPEGRDVYLGLTTVPEPLQDFTWYQPSLRVNSASIIPPDMTVRRIIPHKYGVFTYMGAHRPEDISSATLSAVWRYVFESWMPTVELKLEEKFHFELIDYAKCNKSYCECDLYFPIAPL